MTHVRVGARGSDLSLAQTRWTIDRLCEANPGLTAEIVVIHTHGDKDQVSSLQSLGAPGGFVKEIERALLDGEVDLAIHSLKDVPTLATPGLDVAAIPRRAPVEDVLLTREPIDLDRLPKGFVVGTSSPRREHQIKRHAPQVQTVPMRGNVPTRIRHLEEGRFDGIMLAAAGLERLGIVPRCKIILPAEEFLPAPGQGALGVQVRQGGPATSLVRAIDDAGTRAAVTAERAFLQATGGGCHAALGAYATLEGGRLVLRGELFVGERYFKDTVSGAPDDAESLGHRLATVLVPASRAGAGQG